VSTNVAQRAGGITDATVTARHRIRRLKACVRAVLLVINCLLLKASTSKNERLGRHPGRDGHRGPVTAWHWWWLRAGARDWARPRFPVPESDSEIEVTSDWLRAQAWTGPLAGVTGVPVKVYCY
jgi:hypothetical protein